MSPLDKNYRESNAVALSLLEYTVMFHVASELIGNFQKLSVYRSAKRGFTIRFCFRYSEINSCSIFLSSGTTLFPAVFAVELVDVLYRDITFDARMINASFNASEKLHFE